MRTVIEISSLAKSYANFPVFFDLNLNIRDHTATALLGPNGCGKTTLIKSILGITNVNFGSISIFNKPILLNGSFHKKNLSDARKKIGFIPDKTLFFEHLSAFEYLKLIDVLSQDKKTNSVNEKDFKNIHTILHEFRLDRWSNRLIHTFSSGTRQKLALAASLVHQPELLIMDEPFRGIDPESHYKFLNYLHDYKSKGLPLFGIKKPGTIFICTHILDDVEKLCDNVVVMNEYGEIVLSGEVKDVKDNLLGDRKFEELLYQILHEKDENLETRLDYEEIHKELDDDF
jgi:ABC-2 type transport system ATP-binding protein